MPYDPNRHRRRSIRWKGHDYCEPGSYFVTMVSEGRLCLFGDIKGSEVVLSGVGGVIASRWGALSFGREWVQLAEWVLMPNHFHGIVTILPSGGTEPNDHTDERLSYADRVRVAKGTVPGSLGSLIQTFKAESTRRVNRMLGVSGTGNRIWQRNYWDHVIRNEREYAAIAQYIESNPAQWAQDRLHPDSDWR